MRNISYLFFIYLFLVAGGCRSGKNHVNEFPVAKYANDTFYFNKIKKGSVIDVSFSLKNAGKTNLIIKNSSLSCGCTKIKTLKDTIATGEMADLQFTYDSKNDSGNILKTIVLETNANPKLHVLYIKGHVE